MNTKRTPTPWRAGPNGISIYANDADLISVSAGFGGQAEREANAAFIVLACNAHDDLVAALEMSLDWLSSYPGFGSERAHNTARAALAKANGETTNPQCGYGGDCLPGCKSGRGEVCKKEMI